MAVSPVLKSGHGERYTNSREAILLSNLSDQLLYKNQRERRRNELHSGIHPDHELRPGEIHCGFEYI
jgi:hypothetical protein